MREREDPDPGKTPRIRWCMGVGERRWRTERKANRNGRKRLLHEETLAGRRVTPAGGRLFLDLAKTELKHFGC